MFRLLSIVGGSFSFHNRNERTATRGKRCGLDERKAFQFPQSERTNCNERGPFDGLHFGDTFSFHNRNERTATREQELALAKQLAFSFHNRNERTATAINANVCVTASIFQFPQSERTNCNILALSQLIPCDGLSVSTIGTNELQHDPHAQGSKKLQLSVSTIGTNELQPVHTAAIDEISRLSVSTIGTNELQLSCRKCGLSHIPRFQFPQSERTNCNSKRVWQAEHDLELSVSTIGTNELQPISSWRSMRRRLNFQFPQSERTNCNFRDFEQLL